MGAPAKNSVSALYEFSPFDPAEAAELAHELGLPGPTACLLARRGITTAAEARAFLAAAEEHDPGLFPDMPKAVGLIRRAIADGRRITVHGDYDADGVCATAIVVEGLRSLGADCDWFIPSRLADGYGLDEALPDRLTERRTELLITVDCGISAAEVIETLAAAGVEAIVTDHHRPPSDAGALPGCPVLHPAIGYPFEGLCGSGVAAKLVQALGAEKAPLELAALATVADSVPLLGENRRIVREGLRTLSTTPRPGLRALMSVAGVVCERVDARDVAFRLAPRINAAGRLYRADAAVELLLCDSVERGAQIATELDRANEERRRIESEVTAAAQRQAAEQFEDGPLSALVLAGQDWHPGVVGISASRMAERHGIPAILISLGEDGIGVGSGRSVPGVDLLAALGECGDLLSRFGGHAAAAGLEVDRERLGELRAQFTAAIARQTEGRERVARDQVDGVLAVGELNLALARSLEALGPFGHGNPEPRFVVGGAVAEQVRLVGENDRHARLTLRAGGQSALAMAFGAGARAAECSGRPVDAVVRLGVNEWNGSTSAQAIVDVLEPAGEPESRSCCLPAYERATEYLDLVCARLAEVGESGQLSPTPPEPTTRHADRPVLGALGDLVTSGRRVAIITADARRRSALATTIGSLCGGPVADVLCSRCARPFPPTLEGPLITDWAALASTRGSLDAAIVAIVDPAPRTALRRRGLAAFAPGTEVFELWGPAEAVFALECFRAEWNTRMHAAAVYRALRDAEGDYAPETMARAIGGEGPVCRTPDAAARAIRVLGEIGLVEHSRAPGSGGALEVRVVSSERTELHRSDAYRRFEADQRAGESFLSQQQRPAA